MTTSSGLINDYIWKVNTSKSNDIENRSQSFPGSKSKSDKRKREPIEITRINARNKSPHVCHEKFKKINDEYCLSYMCPANADEARAWARGELFSAMRAKEIRKLLDYGTP